MNNAVPSDIEALRTALVAVEARAEEAEAKATRAEAEASSAEAIISRPEADGREAAARVICINSR